MLRCSTVCSLQEQPKDGSCYGTAQQEGNVQATGFLHAGLGRTNFAGLRERGDHQEQIHTNLWNRGSHLKVFLEQKRRHRFFVSHSKETNRREESNPCYEHLKIHPMGNSRLQISFNIRTRPLSEKDKLQHLRNSRNIPDASNHDPPILLTSAGGQPLPLTQIMMLQK